MKNEKTTKQEVHGTLGADDRWGLMSHYGSAYGFLHGADINGIDSKDGTPFVTEVDERMFNAITKIQNIFKMDGCFMNNTLGTKFGYNQNEGFLDGKSLFLIEVLGNAAAFRDMDTDFGIIPLPKYDEAQDSYHGYYSPATNGFCIPVTVGDVERTVTVVEVMSAYGYEKIRPAYYDVVLEGKTVRDTESSEMLDIMFDNCVTDLAYLYQWGSYHNVLKGVCTTSDGDIVSKLTASRASVESAIANFIDSLK